MFDVLGKVVDGDPRDLSELLDNLNTQELADLIFAHEQALTRLGDFKLILAAAWADHHSSDAGSSGSMLTERSLEVGGAGTPTVREGGVDEFGDLSSVSNGTGRRVIADALDLRHRLPLLWVRVCRGTVLDWQARKIAQATRILTLEAAREVDRRLEPWIGQLSWTRLQTLVDAEILRADPDLAARLAAEADDAKGVWSGSTNHRNIKSVYARTDPVSAAWFMGMVNRIADLLAADGDQRSADQRRAAAIGILARPADALTLLRRHATPAEIEAGNPEPANPKPADTEPGETDSAETASSAELTLPLDGTSDSPSTGSGNTADLEDWDLVREPDPDDDQACVAEYQPIGHPREHPPCPPPDEPDQPDELEPEFHLRVTLDPPAAFDARAARPTVVLTFHLSDTALKQDGGHAQIRSDHARHIDPATLTELTSWLAGTGSQIVIKPVIDPAATAPADAYEIPDRIRTAVRYRDIADVSPWGSSTNMNLDLDHTKPYRKNGPPGQTRLGNLAPFARPVHRAKTVGAKQIRQPEPGIYLWRTRHAHLTLVTNRGSINLGRSPFTETLWHLARDYEPSAVETKIIDICYNHIPISA